MNERAEGLVVGFIVAGLSSAILAWSLNYKNYATKDSETNNYETDNYEADEKYNFKNFVDDNELEDEDCIQSFNLLEPLSHFGSYLRNNTDLGLIRLIRTSFIIDVLQTKIKNRFVMEFGEFKPYFSEEAIRKAISKFKCERIADDNKAIVYIEAPDYSMEHLIEEEVKKRFKIPLKTVFRKTDQDNTVVEVIIIK